MVCGHDLTKIANERLFASMEGKISNDNCVQDRPNQ